MGLGHLDGHCVLCAYPVALRGVRSCQAAESAFQRPASLKFLRLRLLTCMVSGAACGAGRVGLEAAGWDAAGQGPQPQPTIEH